MVNEQTYFYQTVMGKQTVVHLIPLFKNFFNPFFVIANGKTTLRTLTRRPKHKQKVNHFDRWTQTYKRYDHWTASKPTLIACPMFFIFSHRTFFKNNFSQPHKRHIGFCPIHKPTLRKTQRAVFCHRTDNIPYFVNLFLN